jgi:hypothetical protein
MSLDPTTSPDDVLIFWFGAAADGDKNTVVYLQNGWKRWFMGQDLLFDLVQHSSKELIARAAGQGPLPAGPLGLEWTTSRGKLARILLLDVCRAVAGAKAGTWTSRSGPSLTTTRIACRMPLRSDSRAFEVSCTGLCVREREREREREVNWQSNR